MAGDGLGGAGGAAAATAPQQQQRQEQQAGDDPLVARSKEMAQHLRHDPPKGGPGGPALLAVDK